MVSLKCTLLDQILLAHFHSAGLRDFKLNFVDSRILDYSQSLKFPTQHVVPLRIFKDYPFFFMIDLALVEKCNDVILSLSQFFADNLNQFIETTTLKKGHSQIGKAKQLDFKESLVLKNAPAYLLEAEYSSDNLHFVFHLLIPRKTLDHLIAILIKKNSSKIDDIDFLYNLLTDLRQEFYRKNLNFPLNVADFFDSLSDKDFQVILGLMLSNGMMSYDVLWALSQKMGAGLNRILTNLSRNQKSEFMEFIENCDQDYDYKWIDIALYHVGLSLEILINDKKIESIQLDRLKKVLDQIETMELQVFFNENPIYNWLLKADEEGIIQDILSRCQDIILAKAFISLDDKSFELIEKNLSKRKLKYLKEDMEYQKKSCVLEEQIKAQYQIVSRYIDLSFKNLPLEQKDLELWINRFQKQNDFDFAVHFVGPIDFALAVLPLDQKIKHLVGKNLKAPLNYFFNYFFNNKIHFNFPYGDLRIKEAQDSTVHSFYRLEKEGKLVLKAFEEKKLGESTTA